MGLKRYISGQTMTVLMNLETTPPLLNLFTFFTEGSFFSDDKFKIIMDSAWAESHTDDQSVH